MNSTCKSVREHWESYRANVVPVDCGAVQLAETQQAFYAGAVALYDLLLLASREGRTVGAQVASTYRAELAAWLQDFMRRMNLERAE